MCGRDLSTMFKVKSDVIVTRAMVTAKVTQVRLIVGGTRFAGLHKLDAESLSKIGPPSQDASQPDHNP